MGWDEVRKRSESRLLIRWEGIRPLHELLIQAVACAEKVTFFQVKQDKETKNELYCTQSGFRTLQQRQGKNPHKTEKPQSKQQIVLKLLCMCGPTSRETATVKFGDQVVRGWLLYEARAQRVMSTSWINGLIQYDGSHTPILGSKIIAVLAHPVTTLILFNWYC